MILLMTVVLKGVVVGVRLYSVCVIGGVVKSVVVRLYSVCDRRGSEGCDSGSQSVQCV